MISGNFSLRFGGNEVQKLSITAGYEPYLPTYDQPLIQGSFTLGFDVDGNGTVGPGETTTIFFNETNFGSTDPTLNPATVLQTQLQSLGGALTDVKVVGIDPHDYEIDFGNASDGLYQPPIQVMTSPAPNWTSGFLPAVTEVAQTDPSTGLDVTGLPITRQPTDIEGIPVSPTNPQSTATAIASYFPYDNDQPMVSVTPVLGLPGYKDGTVFDVRFIGAWGKQDVPPLVITDAADDSGTSLLGSPQLNVRTLKGPSETFRVNGADVDNPFTPQPDFQNQTAPAVAMDADGDFVVTWQSDVPDWMNNGSKADVFARRFTPQAYVDPSSVWADDNGDAVQGVRALGPDFRVNTFTIGVQNEPTIAMDNQGNFAVVWANQGISASYFNGVFAQRFDMNGQRIGGEFEVNTYNTNNHTEPRVALSQDGYMLVMWTESWPGPGYPTLPTAALNGQLYSAPNAIGASTVLLTPAQIALPGNGTSPTAVFNANDDFSVSWTVTTAGAQDPDAAGLQSEGVWARMYSITGTVVRDTFRANSPSFSTTTVPTWPLNQYGGQAGMDSNGDVYISYEGYGPDRDATTTGPLMEIPADVDYIIEQDLLFYAAPFPYGFGYTTAQIAQLRVQLEAEYGSLRGEANGIMFAGFDAAAGTGDPMNIIASDANPEFDVVNGNLPLGVLPVINSMTDGHNARYYLAIDPTVTGGTFTLRLYDDYYSGSEVTAAITINPKAATYPLSTADAIDNALSALNRTFTGYGGQYWDGPISVRYVEPTEVDERVGTPWDSDCRADPRSDDRYADRYSGHRPGLRDHFRGGRPRRGHGTRGRQQRPEGRRGGPVRPQF